VRRVLEGSPSFLSELETGNETMLMMSVSFLNELETENKLCSERYPSMGFFPT